MSNFDFNKAINGEPIYCNGIEKNLIYVPKNEIWVESHENTWLQNGSSIGLQANLTTDPPKKKVKKTVWINIFKSGDCIWNSSIYGLKENAESVAKSDLLVGTYPIEIEVEE